MKPGILIGKLFEVAYRLTTKHQFLYLVATKIIRTAPWTYSLFQRFSHQDPSLPIEQYEERDKGTGQNSPMSWREDLLRKRDFKFKYRTLYFKVGGRIHPRPRIAIIGPVPPARTGIAKYSLDLASELSKYYSVTLVSNPAIESVESADINFDGLELLSPKEFVINKNKFAVSIFEIGNSEEHVFQHKLFLEVGGILDLHEFFLNGLIGQIHLSEPAENILAKYVIASSGYFELAQRLERESKGLVPFDTPANLPYLQMAKSVIVHTAETEKQIKKNYPISLDNKTSVIQLARPNRSRIDLASQKHNQSKSAYVGASFGFLSDNKCVLEVIDALVQFSKMNPAKVEFFFVGECIDENLSKKIEGAIKVLPANLKIQVTGWVDDSTYQNYLDAIDFAVQLRRKSIGEASATALDAALTGKPVVVNAPETLYGISGENLILITEATSAEAISGAITTALADNSSRAQGGTSRLMDQNSLATTALAYKEILDDHIVPRGRIFTLGQARKNATSIFENTSPRRKSLFVDVSSINAHDHGTGIQRTVKALVEKFLVSQKEDLQICPVYYSIEHRRYFHATGFAFNLLNMPSLGLEELPIDPSPGDIFLGLDLTGADYYQKALLHLKKQGLKVTFVVYDLLPLQLPQHFADNSVASFRNWLQMVCNFDGVFAISDSVRKDLISYINTNQINICPDFFVSKIPLGSNFEVTPKGTQPEVLNKEDISEHFVGDVNFLMVGTLEPRKGHTLVLEAFEALWAKGIEVNLIIVGKKGWLVDNLVYRLETHPEFGRKLHWLNFVSDAELESCYELAQCLIFASEGEGFGLPIIEASKRGLPLLLRDIPIFREVAGQSATYFPSRGFEELAFEIEDWLNKYYSHALPDPEDLPVSTWSSSAETFMMEIRRLLF